MSLGVPEIIIIAVIVIVLFGVAKVVGDKRYSRRNRGSTNKDKTAE
jgi:Sec-independent protein translocase protein TatA